MYSFGVLDDEGSVEFEEQWYGEKELKLQIVCSICEKQFTSAADKARHLKTEKHHTRAKLEVTETSDDISTRLCLFAGSC